MGDMLSTGLSIVTLATLAGLGLMRGTITNLREVLKDCRDELAALKVKRVEDATRIATLEADNAALTRVVTGEVHWVALGDQLQQHHDASQSHWATAEDRIDDATTILTDIRDNLRRG